MEVKETVSRFLLLTQPRSGSTWFTKYSENLAKQGGVVTAGEVMHPDSVKRYRARTGSSTDPTASLASYFSYLKEQYDELGRGRGWRGDLGRTVSLAEARDESPATSVGLKILYHQLPTAASGALPIVPGGRGLVGNVSVVEVLKFCAANDILVVQLARVNQLERYISLRAIDAHGLDFHRADGAPTAYSTTVSAKGNSTKEAAARVRLDPADAFAFSRTQLKQNVEVGVGNG